MNKDRIIDVLVLVLIGFGSVALVEKFILKPEDVTTFVSQLITSLSLPVGLAIRLLKWLNDEKLELLKRIEQLQNTALTNREGVQGLIERLEVSRDEINSMANQLRESNGQTDRRLVQLETVSSLTRRLDALNVRISDLDSRFTRVFLSSDDKG